MRITALSLICLSCGTEQAAGPDTEQTESGAIRVKLAVPQELAEAVARVEYVIFAADMDTMRGDLVLEADDVARGIVSGIKPGEGRRFVLNAYDADGRVTHSGSAAADISAGRTAEVHIEMRRLPNGAEISGAFSDQPLPGLHPLVGSWRLEIPGIADDSFEFLYTFEVGGVVINRIGGKFLKELQKLEELQELADIDLSGLKQFDGGLLNLRGTWRAMGDTLELDFDRLDVELVGSLPLIGEVAVEVLEEDLGETAEFEIDYTYSVRGAELRLRGKSATLGVPLGDVTEVGEVIEEVSPVARETLRLAGDFLGEALREQGLDELTLSRIE